jgi:hypothetical protein
MTIEVKGGKKILGLWTEVLLILLRRSVIVSTYAGPNQGFYAFSRTAGVRWRWGPQGIGQHCGPECHHQGNNNQEAAIEW